MIRSISAASVVLSLTLLGCGGGAAGSSGASSQQGGQAANFTARDINGKTVQLSDYLGKQAVLLDFWSTFCEPCLAEFPHLDRLYQANKDKGFVILAISMDGPETIANVPAFAKRNNISFPVLLDEDSHVASIFNPKKSAPLSVLIDKSGRVFRVREGYNPGDEELVAKDVAMVLDAPKAP